MKQKQFLITLFISLATYSCFGENPLVPIVEEVSKNILLKENPDMGVFSLRVQSSDVLNVPESQSCNPNNSEYLQILCDAEASCTDFTGADKLACIYEQMKTPVHEMERNYKRDHDNRDHDDKYAQTGSFAVWYDVKKLYNEIKHFVHEYREGLEEEEHDETGHDSEEDEEEDESLETLNRIYKVYSMIQEFKDKYSQSDMQVPVKILSIEAYNSGSGWVKINRKEIEVDFGQNNLNRIIAENILDPKEYTAIRVTFGQISEVRLRNPFYSATVTTSGKKHEHDDDEVQNDSTATEWITYPLVWADPDDGKQRTIRTEIPVDAGKGVELRVSLNLGQSLSEYEGSYYFDPVFDVNSIDGEGYSDPNLPVNLTFDNGNLTVQADANAFNKPVRFAATRLSQAEIPNLEPGTTVLASYEMNPSMVFRKAITLKIKYDPNVVAANGGSAENIRARYYNPDRKQWILIPSFSVDEAAGTINVYTNHFTIIQVEQTSRYAVEYANGISAKVDFKALEYLVTKSLGVKSLDIPADHASETYAGYGYLAAFNPPIPLRYSAFQISFSKSNLSPNGIVVRLTAPEVYLGQIDLGFIADSSVIARGASNLYLTNVDMEIHYDFKVDPNSQTISAHFVHFSINNADFSYREIPNLDYIATWYRQWLINSLADAFNPVILNFINRLGNNALGAITEYYINQALADTHVDTFTIGASGINLQSNLYSEIDEMPDHFGSCYSNPNLTIPADTPSTVIHLPAATDFGVGFSMTAINQVITYMANRGDFCASQDLGGSAQVFIQPKTAPAVEYLGNYLTKVSFEAEGHLVNNLGLHQTSTGTVEFYFRFFTNIGGNGLNFSIAKVFARFSDPTINSGAQQFAEYVNGLAETNPEQVAHAIYLDNPFNSSGFQASMFRINSVEQTGGMLVFGIDLHGLSLDYENQGRNIDWFWTNKWTYTTNSCSAITKGTLIGPPIGNTYKLQLVDKALPLVNAGIPAEMLNRYLGEEVILEGKCIKRYKTDPVRYVTEYVVSNIVNDQMYMNERGDLLPKRNFAAQTVDNYSDTVGLYDINIDSTATPEILQVLYTQDGGYQFNWILSDTCCWLNKTNVTNYSEAAPSIYNSTGIYRVSVIKQSVGTDQLLINCDIYDVSTNGSSVTLTLNSQICTDPFAGMVKDDQYSLMWTKCNIGEQMYDPDCGGEAQTFSNYQQAEAACTNLDLAGFTDWRLPTRNDYYNLNAAVADEFPEPDGIYFTRSLVAKSLLLKIYQEATTDNNGNRGAFYYFNYGKFYNGSIVSFALNSDSTITRSTTNRYVYYSVAPIGSTVESFTKVTVKSQYNHTTYPDSVPSSLPAERFIVLFGGAGRASFYDAGPASNSLFTHNYHGTLPRKSDFVNNSTRYNYIIGWVRPYIPSSGGIQARCVRINQ